MTTAFSRQRYPSRPRQGNPVTREGRTSGETGSSLLPGLSLLYAGRCPHGAGAAFLRGCTPLVQFRPGWIPGGWGPARVDPAAGPEYLLFPTIVPYFGNLRIIIRIFKMGKIPGTGCAYRSRLPPFVRIRIHPVRAGKALFCARQRYPCGPYKSGAFCPPKKDPCPGSNP